MVRIFTKKQNDFIYQNYKNISSQQLASLINKEFGTSFTAIQLRSFKVHHKLKSGYNNHFKPGTVPWNKGTKGVMKANSGSFKPSKIGQTNIHDGYKIIKTLQGWQQYSRYMYEKYHDCKLTSDERINYLDGDKSNFAKENLIKVTKQEVARLHHDGYSFDNPDLNKASINVVRLKMKVREANAKNRKNK